MPLLYLSPRLLFLPTPNLQVQLVRIQMRVPEYGWTTQKVFHLLNFLCMGMRAGVFASRELVEELTPKVYDPSPVAPPAAVPVHGPRTLLTTHAYPRPARTQTLASHLPRSSPFLLLPRLAPAA